MAMIMTVLVACGPSHTDAPGSGGTIVRQGSIPSQLGDRTYRAYLPASLDRSAPTALVFVLHGAGEDAALMATMTGFDELAERAGFIAVYPEGYHGTWNAGRCCGDAVTSGAQDVRFIADLLNELEADRSFRVDAARVYAAGFSVGGHMAYRLGCDLGDRIAAIGVVAGVLIDENCHPARPVPLLHIHGTSDHVVPYEGQSPPNGLPSVAASAQRWRTLNPGADVQLLTVPNGGHVWFRAIGGSPSLNIEATPELWEFFLGHPRP